MERPQIGCCAALLVFRRLGMPEDILSQALRIRFEFKRRPVAITADFRPQWRVALLVLMLEKCWGRRATLGQLHVINWALRSRENLSNFLQQIEGHFRPGKALVRFEPSLNRAIDLAVGEK